MGITIHYKGKAKSREAIDGLIETLTYFAKEKSWEYWHIDQTLKGRFYPSWGYGFGYVPTPEQVKKYEIEFFPKMVSRDCNGYFNFFETRYADEVRNTFKRGVRPTFHINTKQKGICLNIHPECETLEFSFDLQTLELANYSIIDERNPWEIWGSGGFFCKTQFAGFETHKTVCALIKMTERYIDYADIYDEADFYQTLDEEKTKQEFSDMTARIQDFGKLLQNVAERKGCTVAIGQEIKKR